jgi:ubiquinone/menaquinone biosynthesis C-methylase UbiE
LVDDTTAEAFALYMKKFPDLYEYLAEIVRTNITEERPCIIDLGVGPGLLSVELHRKMPQAQVIGIDPLMKMLRLAKENTKNSGFFDFEPLLGVSEQLPFKNNSVTLIVSRFSLPYWKQPEQSFQEMKRILKPGGRVVLEALNKDFPSWKLLAIKIHMLFNRAGRDVTKYHIDAYKDAHSMEQVQAYFTGAGFTILQKEGKKGEWRFIVVAEKK